MSTNIPTSGPGGKPGPSVHEPPPGAAFMNLVRWVLFGGLTLLALGSIASFVAWRVQSGRPSSASARVALYHCPMHPSYTSDKPGDCPICNMKLEPVPTSATTHTGHEGDVPGLAPVQIAFTNATPERYALMITRLRDHDELTMTSFLSGAELLSNQTFRELFATETIAVGEGLAVKRLALLFTDLQGSTALDERIGDLKAFELVRQHFEVLRECIASNSGAFVKTIGDAVMASFVERSAAEGRRG